MTDMQLSFLATAPTAYDVNAVDDGVIHDGGRAQPLVERAVDDTVLGLGFTNWRALIDHAIRTGHYELFDNGAKGVGLRKAGFKHSPIPALPADGVRYVHQRLLAIASERGVRAGRHEKMITVTAGFSHKCVFEKGVCDITVKQDGAVVRTSIAIDELDFSGQSANDPSPLAKQLESVLVSAGAAEGGGIGHGSASMASHILRYGQGLR